MSIFTSYLPRYVLLVPHSLGTAVLNVISVSGVGQTTIGPHITRSQKTKSNEYDHSDPSSL